MIAHRVRKAAVRRGAKVACHQPARAATLLFPRRGEPRRATVSAWRSTSPPCCSRRCATSGQAVPALARLPRSRACAPSRSTQRIARAPGEGESRLVLLGALAQRHRRLCRSCARWHGTGRRRPARGSDTCPRARNAVGAALAGVMPHRGAGGRPRRTPRAGGRRDACRADSRPMCWWARIEPADFAAPSRAAAVVARRCRLRRRADAVCRRPSQLDGSTCHPAGRGLRGDAPAPG